MTDQPNDPKPPGVMPDVESIRTAILRAIMAQPVPDVRGELAALFEAGAPMHVDNFDATGNARLGLMAPDGLLVFGEAHWRSLVDNGEVID